MAKGSYNKEFKAIFNIKMKSKGFSSVRELSKHLGYKASFISHFFTGDIDIKQSDLNKIFDFLEIEDFYREIFLERIEVEPRYEIKRKEVEKDV